MRVEGDGLKGCYSGINFLSRTREWRKDSYRTEMLPSLGGVTRPLTVRETSLRLGAERVSIIYRRTRKEMPANEVEIEAADHEGVEFHYLSAPTQRQR